MARVKKAAQRAKRDAAQRQAQDFPRTSPPRRNRSPLPHRGPQRQRSYSPPPANGSVFRFEGRSDHYRPRSPPPPQRQNRLEDRISHDRRPQSPRRDDRRDNRRDFSFRSDYSAPQFHPQNPSDRQPRRDNRSRNNQNRQGQGQNRRRFVPFPPTHDRAIIRALNTREKTPDRLSGMVDGSTRFKDVAELSESMEESTENTSNDEADAPRKRQNVETEAQPAVIPKWSNPDPYTVLPPVGEETRAKKTDVVQLIRKAKIAASEANGTAKNDISGNIDFVSLNFDSSDDDSESGELKEDSDDDVILLSSNQNTQKPTHNATLLPRNVNGKSIPPIPSHLMGNGQGQASYIPTTVAYSHQAQTQTSTSTYVPPDTNLQANSYQSSTMELTQTSTIANSVSQISQASRADDRSNKRKRERLVDKPVTISSLWISKNKETDSPWVTIDHSETKDMGFWLHKEVWDFYDFVKPRPHEERIRQDLVNRISRALRIRFPGCEIQAFGSFKSGLYLPTADMDLVLVSPSYLRQGIKDLGAHSLTKAKKCIQDARISNWESLAVIRGAKVPIVKFKDIKTSLPVDISFDNLTGVVANKTFQDWRNQYPAIVPLVAIMKQLLLMRDLNEVFSGGLGGFSIICLVTSFLQNHPAVQSGQMIPEHHLGQLLIEMLDFYGNKFNRDRTAITMNPPGYFPKYELPGRFSIFDPNDSTNDVSRGTIQAPKIAGLFSDACQSLKHRMNELHSMDIRSRRSQSILSCIIGGDYSSFDKQRALYDQLESGYSR